MFRDVEVLSGDWSSVGYSGQSMGEVDCKACG